MPPPPPLQTVPPDALVLSALASHRAHLALTSSPSAKPPNSKSILRALTAHHPDWKLTQQRLVKVLKREGCDENDAACANAAWAANDASFSSAASYTSASDAPAVMSPATRKRVGEVDGPVAQRNVLGSRLRPRAALSFVYGAAKALRSPAAKSAGRTEKGEGEEEDPTFVPRADLASDGEGAGPAEPWTRARAAPVEVEEVVLPPKKARRKRTKARKVPVAVLSPVAVAEVPGGPSEPEGKAPLEPFLAVSPITSPGPAAASPAAAAPAAAPDVAADLAGELLAASREPGEVYRGGEDREQTQCFAGCAVM
ncbi:hypothetical protein TeGR_g14964 [Tetraparma gracilis]|uniref:Uncharacterized protein n=1 Tax=Tetraparma gracilis TaxID=2962635 RepID=A0ABQ6M436_9STRA|nr:hypothetical protein TeGR_g14964 [Tetraparma gracilis]